MAVANRTQWGALLVAACVVATLSMLAVRPVAATDWDPARGEYRRLAKDRATVAGRIIGLEVFLKHRPGGADVEPGDVAPATQVLRADDGRIWHILENPRGVGLARDPQWLGREVSIQGWLYPEAAVVEVDRFTWLRGGEGDRPFRFCFDCRRMVSADLFERAAPDDDRPAGRCRHAPVEQPAFGTASSPTRP